MQDFGKRREIRQDERLLYLLLRGLDAVEVGALRFDGVEKGANIVLQRFSWIIPNAPIGCHGTHGVRSARPQRSENGGPFVHQPERGGCYLLLPRTVTPAEKHVGEPENEADAEPQRHDRR